MDTIAEEEEASEGANETRVNHHYSSHDIVFSFRDKETEQNQGKEDE